MTKPYIYYFPDGNAFFARLLVRSLVPAVGGGKGVEDIVTSHFDYSKLDVEGANTRLRLNTTVIKVANQNTPEGPKVDLLLLENGTTNLRHIRATHCIMTCFNMSIPYIVEGLSEIQSKALKQNVKCPLVYSNVVVRNWEPWVKLGVHDVFGVKSFHSRMKLDYPVNIGNYQGPSDPSQPAVVHMVHVPNVEGAADVATALRMARKTLFANKFDVIESKIKDDLTKMFGSVGFDAEKDILAITINRWSHGYSWFENSLSLIAQQNDHDYEEEARQRFGNIFISGSDAGWSAYAHSAFEQAHRAVEEIPK